MKKIFAIMLSLLMVFCFAGCDKNADTDMQASTESGPSTTIDPCTIDWGYYAQEDVSDRWYQTDTDDVIYIYFTQSNSGNVCTYHLVQSGVVVESTDCVLSGENHLIPVDESAMTLDLVFQDAFTVFDYVSGNWYSRGDQVELTNQFVGKTYTEESDNTNTIVFNEDYTCTETFEGIAYPGTFEITAKKTLRCVFEENVAKFKITYNDDQSVNNIECDGRVFYPETKEDETINKYKAY
ncbi:MAG: hypothetical protein E7513_06375 [Ruminococcaceae bacterium]|nr:hypothetical protein [Oscillospiraceae bacterium]